MINNFVESALISLPLWVNSGYYIKNYTGRENSYVSRIYSNIHAIINILSTILFLLNYISKINYSILLGVTFSYAIFDLKYILIVKDYPLIIHHLLIVISLLPFYNLKYIRNLHFLIVLKLLLGQLDL